MAGKVIRYLSVLVESEKSLDMCFILTFLHHRWSFDYDGITFITDQSRRREVTAYPSPLPDVPVDQTMISHQTNVKTLIQHKPELSTSHTILVIDNSGSMLAKKNDVHLYRDSQNAAFSMTALDFVAEQLLSQTAVNSDLVSLIKFSSVSTLRLVQLIRCSEFI